MADTISEPEVRALLARRTDWLLLRMFECTEDTRDRAQAAGRTVESFAAVEILDWILDELDGRYPAVMGDWMGRRDRDRVDLLALYMRAASLAARS